MVTDLGPQQLAPMLVGVYLMVGLLVSALLQHGGQERGAVLGALIAWPMLLPLLQSAPPTPQAASGPLRARIDGSLGALVQTLGDPAAAGVPWSADLDGLQGALRAADARLGLVDRLLGEGDVPADEAVAQGMASLRQARERAAAEIEAVLSEVVQLRLQVGVAALAGDSGELSGRLRELSARAGALQELADLDQVP